MSKLEADLKEIAELIKQETILQNYGRVHVLAKAAIALKEKAEIEDWPQWKKDTYNEMFADGKPHITPIE